LVGQVRRELAMRYPPDRGGSVAEMAAVNNACDRLLELAETN
jgi:hypothetical protein